MDSLSDIFECFSKEFNKKGKKFLELQKSNGSDVNGTTNSSVVNKSIESKNIENNIEKTKQENKKNISGKVFLIW